MRFFGRLTYVVVAPVVVVVATAATAGAAPAIVHPATKHRVRRARKTVTAKGQLEKR